FGTMEFGSGTIQPKEKIRSEPVQRPTEPVQQQVVAQPETQPAKEAAAEAVMTSDNEESIRSKQQEKAKREADEVAKKAKAEAERIEREQREAEERQRQEQEAKKKNIDALIGGIGKSDGTASGSEGDDQRPGDKGSPEGDPYAHSYYGAPGSGTGTGGYGLKGRTLADQGKVQQECNQAGTVVVQIVVGRDGKVLEATPGVKGTTNNDACLLKPAKETAMRHRWNPDPNAPAQQIGFVVVNFKLGQ